jgi:hypothetical protein
VPPTEQLQRRLPKVANLFLHGRAQYGVLDGVQVGGTLISQVEEHVARLLGGTPALLAAEHQVYPVVQVGRGVVALQRLPHDAHELVG